MTESDLNKAKKMSGDELYHWQTFYKNFIWIIPVQLFSIIINFGWVIIVALTIYSLYGIRMNILVSNYISYLQNKNNKK